VSRIGPERVGLVRPIAGHANRWFVLGLILFGLLLLAPSAVAGPDLTGTWSCCGAGGAAAQEWTLTSGTGSLSGEAATGGSVFATVTGSVSGNSVEIVTTYNSFDPGYVATFLGTVDTSDNTMMGTWTSNAGQSGTWTADLAGASTTGGNTADQEDKSCVDGCSNFEFDYQNTIDPSDSSDDLVVGAGCGGTAAKELPRGGDFGDYMCGGFADIPPPPNGLLSSWGLSPEAFAKAISGELTGKPASEGAAAAAWTPEWPAPPPNFMNWGLSPQTLSKLVTEDLSNQPETTAAAINASNVAMKALSDVEANPTDATQLQDADTDLAPDFPATYGSDAPTQSAAIVLRHVSAGTALDPIAVIDSLVLSHPTHTDLVRFGQAIQLATATTYSPARAEARLSLVAAVEIGESLLAHELHKRSVTALLHAKLPPIASGFAFVKRDRASKLALKPTALAGQILRVLEVWGLGHHVTLKLQVAELSKRGAKLQRTTKTITVR
jgi:hypothetical protein